MDFPNQGRSGAMASHPPRRRMRVLAAVVVPPHLSVSGGARAAEQLSEALAPHCDITIANMMAGALASRQATDAAPGRIAVRTGLPPLLPWSRLPNRHATLFYRSDIPDIIARGHDLVHLHNPMPGLEFGRIARACRRAGTPYVISTHGFNEVANGATIYGFDAVRRLAWRRLVVDPVAGAVRGAAAVFALSPADVGIVRAMGFTGEVRIVNNGVPLPDAGDAAGDAAVLRRFGVAAAGEATGIRCMFLANHTPNKGLPDLLEAFTRISGPATLVIGGERRDAIDYERHLKANGPGRRIIVTGRLSDAEVAALFRQSDLFVFPTLADTFPLVVLEAMSHGVPVLASRVGGIPHQIDDSCGRLVPPGDPAALAAAIDSLAADPHRLKAMGDRARRKVQAEFTWARAAEHAREGYREVLQRRTAGLQGAGRPMARRQDADRRFEPARG